MRGARGYRRCRTDITYSTSGAASLRKLRWVCGPGVRQSKTRKLVTVRAVAMSARDPVRFARQRHALCTLVAPSAAGKVLRRTCASFNAEEKRETHPSSVAQHQTYISFRVDLQHARAALQVFAARELSQVCFSSDSVTDQRRVLIAPCACTPASRPRGPSLAAPLDPRKPHPPDCSSDLLLTHAGFFVSGTVLQVHRRPVLCRRAGTRVAREVRHGSAQRCSSVRANGELVLTRR